MLTPPCHRNNYNHNQYDEQQVLSAIATIVANVFFGYSRDLTSSYKDDLVFLVVLCFLCLAITVFLIFWDARHCQSLLNRGKRVMLLTDVTAVA